MEGQLTLYRTNQASESRDQIGFWLSVLLLCLLPIEHWRFPLNLKPADLALVLLTLYGLLKARHTHQRLDFPLLLPMWLILFSSSVATLVGFARLESIIAIAQEIYIFVWFIALTNVLKAFPLSDLDRLMKVWSVVACAESVTTLMGMLRVGPSMFYERPTFAYDQVTTEFIRAVGTYDNSNAVAVYLSISFFVLLATSWPMWLRSVLAVWLFAGMFGTGSNGALLSTLGSLVLLVGAYSALQNRQDINLLIAITGIGVGIVTGVLFALGLSSSLLSRFGLDMGGPLLFQTLGRLSHSLASRADILGRAWETYRRHLLGTGPNSFSSLIGGSLHNDYAAFLFERGPVGLIGWLWMIGATLLTSLRAANQLVNKCQRWQVLTLGAGFLACAVNAFSHEISHMRQVWILVAFLFALCYANLSQQATRPPDSTEAIQSIRYAVK
jgi:hypothetical protein